MATQPKRSKLHHTNTWRGVIVCLLTIAGLVSFTGFTVAHWLETEVLDADAWVSKVQNLPKVEEVASAVSTYAVNQLFTTNDLEQRIEQALPEKAGFLAAPLSTQLQSFLTTQTQRIIQSDAFNSIWITANTRLFDRIVTQARAPNAETTESTATLSVPLQAIKDAISTILKDQGIIKTTETGESVLTVNLKTSVENMRQYVRVVDFLNATLWLLALALLLGAVVISRYRWRLLLIITISIVVIALLQLIGIRVLRPALINYLADASAAGAAGVVYDIFLESFRQSAVVTLILGAIAFILVFFLSPRILRKSKTISGWLDSLKKSWLAKAWQATRNFMTKYRWFIVGAAALIALILAAFVVPISWLSATISLLIIILIGELTSLMAVRGQGSTPMK